MGGGNVKKYPERAKEHARVFFAALAKVRAGKAA